MEPEPTRYTRPAPRWLKLLLAIGIAWGQVVLIASAVNDPTPENLTLLAAIELSGLYTVLLYCTRDRWMPRLAAHPLRNGVLVGIFNAALVETIFLLCEKFFGAAGIAAHPNLLVDLALTMPWYIGMVYFFARIQERYQYSDAAVLLIGGFYEIGADGVIGGQALPILFGQPVFLLQNWFFLLLVALWQFVLVYSSILLPAACLLEGQTLSSINRPVRWTRVLLWLIPYFIYLIWVMATFFIPS